MIYFKAGIIPAFLINYICFNASFKLEFQNELEKIGSTMVCLSKIKTRGFYE